MNVSDQKAQDHEFGMLTGRYLGIDPSLTKTGVSLLSGTSCITGLLKPTAALRGVERLLWFRERFGQLLRETRPYTIMIEGYAYGRINKAHDIGELGGVLRMALHDARAEWRVIPPSTLKMFATGKGACGKPAVVLALLDRWGLRVPQEDEADATVLAILGLELGEGPGRVPLIAAQRRALAKINQ